MSVFTGSKQIEPSFEACARPKSASWKRKGNILRIQASTANALVQEESNLNF